MTDLPAALPGQLPEIEWEADGSVPDMPAARPPWAPKTLSGRHLIMIEYHLAGMTNKEIAEALGMTAVCVGMVLRSPPAREWMAGRIDDLNTELHGMFAKVVAGFDEALGHESIDIKLKAMDMWLKSHGRYAHKKDEKDRVTVEDVIKRLFDHAESVTVNVDNRQVHVHDGPPPSGDKFDFLEGS